MINIVFANSSDRWIRSRSTSSYDNALFGNALTLNEDDIAVVGQTYASSEGAWYVRQYFMEFPYSRDTGQIAVSGHFRLQNSVTHGTNVSRDVEVREYDWETPGTVTITPDRGDWRTPSLGISPLTISGRFERTHLLANNAPAFAGFMRVRAELTSSSSTLSYIVNSSRNRLQQTPSGAEYNTFNSTRASGTANDPQLVVGEHTLSRMTTVLAAQTQLSDGTWIYLERNNLDEEFTLDVKHRDLDDNITTILSQPITGVLDNDNMRSSQGYGLCRDKNDNFFITYPRYSNTENLTIRGFTKGGGHTWTAGSELYWSNLSDDAYSNTMQVLCAWHDIGTGRLVVFAMRDWGVYGGAQDTYFLIDAAKVLANQTGFVLTSGKGGSNGFTAMPPNVGNYNSINPTGTLMDLIPDAVDAHSGYLLTAERGAVLGQNAATSVGRYKIHSSGNLFNSFTFSFMDSSGGFSTHDPDAKLRAISVGRNELVKIAADARSGWGLTLDRFSFTENATSVSHVGRVRMANEGITSFPDNSLADPPTNTLNSVSTWDAVYFPVDNRIWIYYFNANDSQQLVRTSINLNDNLAAGDEIEVNAMVGASGDTMHAIRVQRNNMNSDEVLVTVAYDSGGTHSYEYIVDRINAEPTQPTLDPVTNFNATNNKNLTWNFQSPNFSNSQTAFQLVIIDRSDSSTALDTGKVSSSSESYTLTGGTIDNDKDYFWQVKTWDIEDAESPYSDQGTFSTSASGVVVIDSPATDLEEIFDKDVLVEWHVDGSPQDEYRILVTRTSDGGVFLDTGWLAGADDEYLVENLVSDVEYEITVSAENNNVASAPASRLVLVHYNTPEIPEIEVSVTPGLEYVTVSVTNPEPRGDRPNPTVNDIYRRIAGTSTPFKWVGNCEPNSSFRDYSVGSGYDYEYKVRAGVEV